MERSPHALTHYDILGVSRDASSDEIKQAYRRLARKYHPDVNPGDPEAVETFQRLSQSYHVLSDPDARARYDRQLDERDAPASQSTQARSPSQPATPSGTSPRDLCNDGLKQNQFGRYERAIELFSAAVQQSPLFAEAYAHRGYAYYQLDRDSDAFADYAEAIRLNPSLAIAYFYRGLTRFKLGYSEAAIEDYSAALELQAHDGHAYYRRGLAYIDVEEHEAAVADLQQAIRLFYAADHRAMQLEVEAVYRRLIRQNSWQEWLRVSQHLITAVWQTVLAALINPTQCGFMAYRQYRPWQAIAVGLILALAYVACFSAGLRLLLTGFRQADSFSLIRSVLLGLLPFVGVSGLHWAARNSLAGAGRLAGDVFAAAVALIPASLATLLIPIFPGTLALLIGAIAISYSVLLLYGGCTQISNLAPGRSAMITALMLVVQLMPFLLIRAN